MKYVVSKDVVGSVCVDGAPTMFGKNSGFVYAEKKCPDVLLHCHKRVTNTLSIVVKIVNYVRGWVIKHRLVRAFCREISSLHAVLLFHAEVFDVRCSAQYMKYTKK